MWDPQPNLETYPSASLVRYRFPAREGMPVVQLTWYDGGLKPERPEELEPGRNLGDNGVLFIGDRGKLLCGGWSNSPRLIPESRMKEYQRPPKSIPRIDGSHEADWVRACKGEGEACSNFDYSGPLSEMVLMGNLAVRSGQYLEWDGENMKVTNHPEINKYVHRPYREGWVL
jgi:hypothetical protein